jgi:hypothetical protein
MLEKIIAYCGLDCSQCGAFLATLHDDQKEREDVSALWSKLYKVKFKPEDINCQGCLSDEMLFAHCKVCEIRKCGQEKSVQNCGYCPDYGCEKLETILRLAPEARKNLDEIRLEGR